MIITRRDLKKDYIKKTKREKTILEHKQLFNQRKPVREHQYGVYFLFRGNKIVYVGKTTRGTFRIWEHVSEGEKLFDTYTFIRCRRHEVDALEEIYIKKYHPEYNVALNKEFRKRQAKKDKKQYGYRSIYHHTETIVEEHRTET